LFRNRKQSQSEGQMLKPQDTLIALKLWADYQQQLVMPLREAASLVGISVSEFSKGLQRLETAKLVAPRDGRRFVERGALLRSTLCVPS
jgi:hypothetical protein